MCNGSRAAITGAQAFLEHTVPNTLLLVSLILTPALGCTARDQHLQLLPNIPKLPKTQATCSGSVFVSPLVLLPMAPSSAQWGPEDAWPPLSLTGSSTHRSWFPATPTCCLSWASAGL